VVLLAAALAMGGAGDAGHFYLTLERPGWAPGVGIFAPVWTFLYLQMAMAAVLVARLPHSTLRTDALSAFGVQLLANAAWSWVFFDLRDGVLALAVISLLWATLAATTALFWRLSRVAGVLMLPAWLWISYAAVLTGWLWADNPGWLG
jgi:translocator protein